MINFPQIVFVGSLIFAAIYAWPTWAAPYEPWRTRAFGFSWFLFMLWIGLSHGGFSKG